MERRTTHPADEADERLFETTVVVAGCGTAVGSACGGGGGSEAAAGREGVGGGGLGGGVPGGRKGWLQDAWRWRAECCWERNLSNVVGLKYTDIQLPITVEWLLVPEWYI